MARASSFTPEQISALLGCKVANVRHYWPPLKTALTEQGLGDRPSTIAALATVATEVPDFAPINEYGSTAYFRRMYEGRADLGNTRAGDGARYHGRGFIQLTGRANYRGYGRRLGVPLERNPDLALDPKIASRVLAAYMKDHGIGALAARGDWRGVRRAVNGGLNGWSRFSACVKQLQQAPNGKESKMSTTATRPKPRATRTAATPDLALTNPHLSGAPVRDAQKLLATNPYGNFQPGTVDGEYGPASAAATKAAKWALGYPPKACDEIFGSKLAGFLRGNPLPPSFQARHKERLKDASGQAGLRAKIVQIARWGIQNEGQIHYQQLRPVDGVDHPRKLPLHTDCSGFSTLCYKWAGAAVDPNGGKWTGAYTGTMLQHCRHIPRSAVQPGDLVVWGAYPGHHVALVLEAGADPLLCSHGQEKGPMAIRFSAESAYQPSPATWLSCL